MADVVQLYRAWCEKAVACAVAEYVPLKYQVQPVRNRTRPGQKTLRFRLVRGSEKRFIISGLSSAPGIAGLMREVCCRGRPRSALR